jgi:hypothetical protein
VLHWLELNAYLNAVGTIPSCSCRVRIPGLHVGRQCLHNLLQHQNEIARVNTYLSTQNCCLVSRYSSWAVGQPRVSNVRLQSDRSYA